MGDKKNCFHGSNKYTNSSHGYPSVFVCVCFISCLNVTHLKKLLEKLKAMLIKTKCADYQNRTQTSKQLTLFHKHLIDIISMLGVE